MPISGIVRQTERLQAATLSQLTTLSGSVRHLQRLSSALLSYKLYLSGCTANLARLSGLFSLKNYLSGSISALTRLSPATAAGVISIHGTVVNGVKSSTAALFSTLPLSGITKQSLRLLGHPINIARLFGTIRLLARESSGELYYRIGLKGFMRLLARLLNRTIDDTNASVDWIIIEQPINSVIVESSWNTLIIEN